MSNQFLTKAFFNVLILMSFSLLAVAQKTQNIQDNPVWATVPVKVDGKTSESAFQAYNKSTLLFYTMSNDDKNLYLVVKSEDNANNNKIMMGGITLSINTDGKKKDKDGFAITYPVIVRQRAQSNGGQRQNNGGQRQGGQGGQGQVGGLSQRTQRSAGASDSVALARRKQQLAAVKEIKVEGFKTITDSLISIYNEYDIMAAAKFDDKGAFVYELFIPLNLLGLTSSNTEFAYNIKINGFQFRGNFGGGERTVVTYDGDNDRSFGGSSSRGGFDPSAFLPTDFWGKYSLAKK